MSEENIVKYCPNCGKKVIPNAKFCIECGNNLKMIFQEDQNQTIYNPEETSQDYNNDSTIRETKSNLITQEITTKQNIQNKPNNLPKEEEAVTPKSEEIKETTYKESINKEVSHYPQQTEGNVTINTSNTLSCPSCGRNMQTTQTSGFFSKSLHHQCNNCQLTFKEKNNYLILENSPQFTRMRSKLHLKRYTFDQWYNILHGEHDPNFTSEFSKWNIDSAAPFTCPACNHNIARYKSPGFSPSYYLICSGCGLTLKEHNNNKYTLYESIENYSPLWKYEKNLLTIEDIKRIIVNEESEENRLFRENKVKENEQKIKEHQLKIKQEEDDLALFEQSLESGNPLLPTPSDTTIVLKKNEVPVYRMYNISLSEPRAVRRSTGSYGGGSVRIAKGVTIHSGRTESSSESHDEIKLIDQGELLITNKRIIFLGSNRTTNIDLNKIISISSQSAMIQIQRSNKQKPEYFNNIYATENFQVDGRQYSVTIDGQMIKKLIMGLI